MIRVLLAIAAALTALALFATSALAWSSPIEGSPEITEANPEGYYLWHDANGFHLRTHGPGEDHYFVARLLTDGEFKDVDAVRLENRDNFAVLNGGHELVLRFRTYGATDGVNFRIEGGEYLRLRLNLDGQLTATDSIFMGPDGKHPATNPFTIKR
ncbi:MAG: hypothetical protein HYY30_11680 [Chloroflexi bacterium]|nr:hypothetical protein [Chloroflexota bacterium]